MAGRQSSAADAFARNFAGGYEIGKDASQRAALRDLAGHSYQDYVIPPQAASTQQSSGRWTTEEGLLLPQMEPTVMGGAPEDAGEAIPYAAGGDPQAVDKLLEADKSQGVLPEDPEYGANPIDRAASAYGRVPKVRVIDWEAAKQAKADMYARAGMRDKLANIDQEFDDLKRRKFQEYASRALQVWDTDPNRAAEYMTMANQFTADGTNSVYMPSPDGKTIMEVNFDEMTQKPLGGGSPVDKTVLERTMLLNSDPMKFAYHQLDREWAVKQHNDQMEIYRKRMEQSEQQHRDNLGARLKGLQVDVAIAKARMLSAEEIANIKSGTDTAEEIADFKNGILKTFGDTEKAAAIFGFSAAFIDQLQGEGLGALVAGAGHWRAANGPTTGQAEAVRAQQILMNAPETELPDLMKPLEDGSGRWVFTDPELGTKLFVPPQMVASLYARAQARTPDGN